MMDLSSLEEASRKALAKFKKGGKVVGAMLTDDTGLSLAREDEKVLVIEDLKAGPNGESSRIAAVIIAAAVGITDHGDQMRLINNTYNNIHVVVIAPQE